MEKTGWATKLRALLSGRALDVYSHLSEDVVYGAFLLSKFNITNRMSSFQNDHHNSNSINKPFLNRTAFSRNR